MSVAVCVRCVPWCILACAPRRLCLWLWLCRVRVPLQCLTYALAPTAGAARRSAHTHGARHEAQRSVVLCARGCTVFPCVFLLYLCIHKKKCYCSSEQDLAVLGLHGVGRGRSWRVGPGAAPAPPPTPHRSQDTATPVDPAVSSDKRLVKPLDGKVGARAPAAL